MAYLLALIAVVAVAVLCWKAYGADRIPGIRRDADRHGRVIGPDDDPEFLWRISSRHGDGESDPDH